MLIYVIFPAFGLLLMLLAAFFWLVCWNVPGMHSVVGAFLGMGLSWLGLLCCFRQFYLGCALLVLGIWSGFRIAEIPDPVHTREPSCASRCDDEHAGARSSPARARRPTTRCNFDSGLMAVFDQERTTRKREPAGPGQPPGEKMVSAASTLCGCCGSRGGAGNLLEERLEHLL